MNVAGLREQTINLILLKGRRQNVDPPGFLPAARANCRLQERPSAHFRGLRGQVQPAASCSSAEWTA